MTTLVTGSGFLAAYVVRDLLAAGERVVVTSRSPNRAWLETIAGEDRDITLVPGDIADLPLLAHTVKDHGVDQIVHLAGLLYHPSEANPALADRVHVQGTMNVFEVAALSGVRKVVWASSMSVYGRRSRGADGYISDASPLDPDSVYGACKALCEQLARTYARRYDLDLTGLRLSSMYGLGKQDTVARGSGLNWLDQLIDRPALGLGPNLVPSGDGMLDFLYIEDAARAVMLALATPTPGAPSFLTIGDFRAVREAFAYVKSLIPDADMELQGGGATLAAQGGPYRADAIAEAIGYRPEYTMEAGLLRNIQAVRGQLEEVA